METTAPLTRSVAETSAVRRETLTDVCADDRAAAVAGTRGTLACAADRLTRSAGASRGPHPTITVAARRTSLARVSRGMHGLLVIGEGVGRIRRGHEVQALRWGRGAGLLVIAPRQQARHVVRRPTPKRDVHHGADQHSHHVMQEAIGLDVIAPPAAVGTRFPGRERQAAAVVR